MGKQGFWDEDLLELQRRYWQRWSEVSAAAAGQSAEKSPWEMAQEHWWQAIAPSAPPSTQDFMSKMMAQGSQLFRMAELFSADQENQQTDWMSLLNRLAEQMKAAGDGSDAPSQGQQWQNLMGFWSAPTESWQRVADSLASTARGPFDQVTGSANPFSPERMLSAPGLGYTREEQAEQQKLLQLVTAYQRALRAYNHYFADIGSEAIERLRGELQQLSSAGRSIDSGRALYDAWITACESVYAERVTGEEFASINGELINSAMRVKQQLGRMIDEYLGSMSMPTRRELRTLQRRLQDNRRENNRLRSELALLGKRLEVLEAVPRRAAAVPGTTRSARKKVAKKMPAGNRASGKSV